MPSRPPEERQREQLLTTLIQQAALQDFVGNPNRHKVQKAVRNKVNLPKESQPGAMILNLPAESRKLLEGTNAANLPTRAL